MAKWVNSTVLDNGLNAIKNGATKMLLIDAYAAGDSYATVIGNLVAQVTMASGDFTISTPSSTSNRRITTAAKSGTAEAAAVAANLHIAFTNGVDTVYWATDETSDVDVANGATVNFPALQYDSNQPT